MLILTAVAVVVALAVFCAYVMGRPSEFEVARHVVIDAPRSVIFEEINSLKRWEDWSPFAQGEGLVIKYEGPSSGIGAASSWDGNRKMGRGRATIVDSKPAEYVEVRLDMEAPLRTTNIVRFTLRSEQSMSHVTWAMTGHNGFVAKLAAIFMDIDNMIGDMFNAGLAKLRLLSESAVVDQLNAQSSGA